MSVIPARICRDMGYTVDEFSSVLPRAMRDWLVIAERPQAWRVSTTDTLAVASVRISRLPDRRIASLSLPVLSVDIEFYTGETDQRAEFLRRFDRGFQKGGG